MASPVRDHLPLVHGLVERHVAQCLQRPRREKRLVAELAEVASNWEIPFGKESSLWPSVAGLVPSSTPVVCGLGPVTRDVYTPNEAVERISLLQRTLLVAEFLAKQTEG